MEDRGSADAPAIVRTVLPSTAGGYRAALRKRSIRIAEAVRKGKLSGAAPVFMFP
jgi:hypothetical protein